MTRLQVVVGLAGPLVGSLVGRDMSSLDLFLDFYDSRSGVR